ncbi:MAG: beta strand repeat-containing protein [Roseibacillus sp.]
MKFCKPLISFPKGTAFAVLCGFSVSTATHAASVFSDAAAGTTTNWDQNWNGAVTASANAPFNVLPDAAIPDIAFIDPGQTIEVDTAIDIAAGDVFINDLAGTASPATLNVKTGGSLTTGAMFLGDGDDAGVLNIQGGTLNTAGVTLSANNPLNVVTVSSGSLANSTSVINVAAGQFNVTGGAVTSDAGLSLTGGEFNQSAGAVTLTDPSPEGGTFQVMPGGTTGTLNLSGGDFIVAGAAGATDTIQFRGIINISGGTMSAQGGQAFGDAATVFNIIGDDADITIDRFNNSTAGRSATFNFVFDESGVSNFKGVGYASLSTTTITIDGSAYNGGPASFELFDYNNIATECPSVTITGFGVEGVDYTFSQSAVTNNFTLTVITGLSEADLTWDGETDANWSTATNWLGDVAPTGAGGEVLEFVGVTNAATSNDLSAGNSYGEIRFSNRGDGESFTLAGNSIQLEGPILSTAVTTPGTDAITDSISLDIELTGGNSLVNLGEDHDLEISGVISEDASGLGLNKDGAGFLTLSNENTYTGVTTVSDGFLRILNEGALGVSGAASGTVVEAGATLHLVGDLTLAEDLTIGGNGDTQNVGALRPDGDITLDGLVTLTSGVRTQPTGGGTLTYNGGITHTGTGVSLSAIGSSTFNSTVDLGTGNFSGGGGGTNVFNVSGNTWGQTGLAFSHTIQLGVSDAIPATSDLVFGFTTTGNSTGALDLNGFDQTVASIETRTSALGIGANNVITGGGTLTVNQDVDTTFEGVIESTTSIVKSGIGILTLSGANTYTGDTTVDAGTLSIASAFLPNFATVSVADGAVLNLNYTGTDSVSVLILDGTSLVPGVYDAATHPASLSGTGSITVTGAIAGYSAWASTNAPAGNPEDDFDGDGVANGVEYVLGGDKDTNDSGKVPCVTVNGGDMVFSFERDQDSIDGTTAVQVEVGTDLMTFPAVYPVSDNAVAASPGVTVAKDSPAAGIDTVTLTIPQAPDAKKFARLVVTP